MSYDFQKLNNYLLSMIYTLLPSWIPGGKFNNKAYLFLSPFRPDKNIGSCSINVETGAYYDFANGDSCHDLISFYARLNNISNCEAYKVLSALYSQEKIINSRKYSTYTRQKPDQDIPISQPEPEVLYREIWFKNSDFGRCDSARFHKVDLNSDDEKFLPAEISEVHCSRACIDESALNQIENNGGHFADLIVPQWYKSIIIDIDGISPIESMLEALRRITGICATKVKVFFSGNKGFHIEFYHPFVEKINGRTDTSVNLIKMIKSLFGDLEGIDLQNYRANGLIRFVNSINSKSGLYKIPLLPETLNSNLTIEQCKTWAKDQRFITIIEKAIY